MTTMTCPFCQIIRAELSAEVLHRHERTIAIRDIRPVAPVHILIIPNKHMASLNELASEDAGLLDAMMATARQIAADEGIDSSGYRLVINTGAGAGQSVAHLHMHLLGGRPLGWPPG
jgi:histidine triad (HIT) family protein